MGQHESLISLIHYIFAQQADYQTNGHSVEVQETQEARDRLYEIQMFLEGKLGNEAKMNDETLRQIYNRIQEKTERMDRLLDTIKDCGSVLALRIGDSPQQRLKEMGIRVIATYDRIEDAVNKAAKGA